MGDLFVIQHGSQRLLWPATSDSIFSQVLANQRQIFVNDLSKDIEIA